MARLVLRRLINAPPERVWDVLADLPGQKAWMVDLRSLEVTSEQTSGLGATIDVVSELFGQPVVKDRMVITAWDPPRYFAIDHVGQFTGYGYFRLNPEGKGTVFTWVEEFKPPLGPLGELGFFLIIGPHLRSVFRRSMDNVKRLAEAGANGHGRPEAR